MRLHLQYVLFNCGAGLSESGQDLCKLYGFDMKRRLCCAMALIGQCQILLLDGESCT